MNRRIPIGILVVLATALAACESAPKSAQPAAPAQTVTLNNQDNSPAIPPTMREMLSELAKGHNDKIQLAWFATTPFKTLQPPVKDFAHHMGKEHKELFARLQAWAKGHEVSLKFNFDDDLYGRARKIMEKTQGDEFQSSGGDDFQRDFLMLMSIDYLTQEAYLKTLLNASPDPELAGYLKDSLAAHEKDRAQIKEFLKHYKYEK
jgi:predicted outer membrane protein